MGLLISDLPFRLWAKTDRLSDRWHALPYHLIDVGSAAEVLWPLLPVVSRTTVCSAFKNEQTAQRVVVFFAASHDIGKANRFFQAKDSRQIPRLKDLGVKQENEPERHGQATAAILHPWLMARWGWKAKAAINVALAVGGHHGVFPCDTKQSLLETNLNYVPTATFELLNALADLYELPAQLPEPRHLNPFLAWLAGFVTVTDWLGSHETMTVWRNTPGDLRAYSIEAAAQTKKLLKDVRWTLPEATDAITVGRLVPAGCVPNSLQQTAGDIAKGGFSLAIVEAPTGEGKTEAAFALAETGRSKGGGVFFALPTMATANGLFARVLEYVQKATGLADVEARLLHSQAWLYRTDLRTVANHQEEENSHVSEDWFASSKRGLLTPFGVGTIDQCLVGALRAKHGFVRLFALAGKTVVVDEVHAYDVYMSDLLARLLGWLKALNCRVVLLSATLPATRREALLRAWGADPPNQAQYPCVTWVGEDGQAQSKTLTVAKRKPVEFRFLDPQDAPGWLIGAEFIANKIGAEGGLGALVLNTVKDAQQAYAWLKENAPKDVEVDLFHARFTAEDRAEREKQILAEYGKLGGRTAKRILVATQVVEQSLDLDFDAIVTALAPIDLLIQRAGRLHRHLRYRTGALRKDHGADERPNPIVYVIPPPSNEAAIPDFEDRVYAEDVMRLTESLLRRGFVIADPSDVASAVDQVYSKANQEDDRDGWQERLEAAKTDAEAKRERHHDAAEKAMIVAIDGWGLITYEQNGLIEDDETPGSQIAARTRLEELPGISLVVFTPAEQWPPTQFEKADKIRFALRTVRLSAGAKQIGELAAIQTPPNWAQAGVSKHAIPVCLDESGRFQTASYLYEYNAERGLTAQRKDAQL